MPASPKEVRAARAYLRQRKITSKEIPPKKFANAARELNKGFRELLRTIGRMQSGGQNQAAQRREAISEAVRKD